MIFLPNKGIFLCPTHNKNFLKQYLKMISFSLTHKLNRLKTILMRFSNKLTLIIYRLYLICNVWKLSNSKEKLKHIENEHIEWNWKIKLSSFSIIFKSNLLTVKVSMTTLNFKIKLMTKVQIQKLRIKGISKISNNFVKLTRNMNFFDFFCFNSVSLSIFYS